jgi:hypothetical protein
MIKDTDFKRIFEVNRKTDRDAELPLLYEFLDRHGPFDSVLDVGSFGIEYAEKIRGLTDTFHACDIEVDDRLLDIVDEFYAGNFNSIRFNRKYDLVLCVSTLEHAGLSTYKGDYRKERVKMFNKCVTLAELFLWISFPVGQAYVYPDQLAIVPASVLAKFESKVEEMQVTQRFLYTQGAQAGHFWIEHDKREVATKIPYVDYIGNQSICVMEAVK